MYKKGLIMEFENIEIKTNHKISKQSLFLLYHDAGWENYTKDMEKLMRAYEKSDFIVSAWDGDIMVAAARAISDGETIVYVQDILVLKRYRRKNIGKRLMKAILNKYEDVRQIVLITDTGEDTDSFYRSCGFKKASKYGISAYLKVN
jgi:GNAT superfamily N-acetyltransferase